MIKGLKSDDGEERWDYFVNFSPFRIEQRIDNKVSLIINSHDSLFLDNTAFYHDSPTNKDSDIINEALNFGQCSSTVFNSKSMPKSRFNSSNMYAKNANDSMMSVGLGFMFVDTYHLFGIPQRKDKF